MERYWVLKPSILAIGLLVAKTLQTGKFWGPKILLSGNENYINLHNISIILIAINHFLLILKYRYGYKCIPYCSIEVQYQSYLLHLVCPSRNMCVQNFRTPLNQLNYDTLIMALNRLILIFLFVKLY